eukprot:snap_masked-scaffold_3-processed-gene-13.17-mRNA-1 protein AED:1.00 eAED:1.00 QI:0/0/0/0/1/1/2/0/551
MKHLFKGRKRRSSDYVSDLSPIRENEEENMTLTKVSVCRELGNTKLLTLFSRISLLTGLILINFILLGRGKANFQNTKIVTDEKWNKFETSFCKVWLEGCRYFFSRDENDQYLVYTFQNSSLPKKVALYMLQNEVLPEFLLPKKDSYINKLYKIKTKQKYHKKKDVKLLKLIDCITFYFYKRYYYVPQTKYDKLSLKLQTTLITKQLCLSNKLIPMKYLTHLNLTKPKALESTGLGSKIHNIAASLHLLNFHNEVYLNLEKDSWNFAQSGKCDYKDYRCYFQPISQCHNSLEELTSNRNFLKTSITRKIFNNAFFLDEFKPRKHSMKQDLLHFWDKSTLFLTLSNKIHKHEPYNRFIPQEYMKKGWLWYYSQLFYFILQPSDSFSTTLLSHEWLNSHEGNCLTLHIRRGDKSRETKTFSVESYLRVVEVANEVLPARNILFLTDDPQLRNEMQNFELNYTVRSLEQPFPSVANAMSDISFGKISGLLASLYGSTKCGCFVGTFSSGWSRTLLKFLTGVFGSPPESWSLDTWAYDINGHGDPLVGINLEGLE